MYAWSIPNFIIKKLKISGQKSKKKASNFEKKICIRNIVKIALKTKLLG